ncbi:MAG: hypothetical protein LBG61_01360 [Burkholderiales bacterium]|nr:hypothetical protein [Burkholderiales bacterium]
MRIKTACDDALCASAAFGDVDSATSFAKANCAQNDGDDEGVDALCAGDD